MQGCMKLKVLLGHERKLRFLLKLRELLGPEVLHMGLAKWPRQLPPGLCDRHAQKWVNTDIYMQKFLNFVLIFAICTPFLLEKLIEVLVYSLSSSTWFPSAQGLIVFIPI